MKKVFSKEYSTETVQGESRIRRSVLSMNNLIIKPSDKINTVYDILKKASEDYGTKRALGTRKVIKLHVEEKVFIRIVDGKEEKEMKDWTYYELSDYEYINFKELDRKAHVMGSGLRALGLACITQSLTIVAAYDTLRSGLVPSFIETGVKGIFCDAKLLSNFVNSLESIITLKVIIYYGEPDNEIINHIKKDFSYITLVSYEEIEYLGKENPVDPVFPSPNDFLCIMYTSGSTNSPKGVIITHANVVASVSGITSGFGPYLTQDDTVLSYLPLAHIYEFVFEMFCVYHGITIGYGTVKTLSDLNCRNCKGDIQTFKPSVMTGVPTVWENVRKGIVQKLNSVSKLRRSLFWFSYKIKSCLLLHRFLGTKIFDILVFKHIRAAMGGRIRVIFNGGASISLDTQKFLSTVLCPMYTGYGLTETSATCTIMTPEQFCLGTVGSISPNVEVKLVDVPDAGYFTNSSPQQGEIWIRGGPVSQGYYNRDQENKEAYADGGWFKTGDIGEWTENGLLRIIDRKKNLVKTQNGEYIALEKLESVYRSCDIISNICVYADPEHVRPVAIVVPSELPLRRYLESKQILFEDGTLYELCQNKEVRHAILNELLKLGKQNNFAKIELLQNIVLIDEDFSVQNELLTAAQKFQRKKIQIKYQKEIAIAYETS
ncbi:unnamed protein product [Pneumocystis jirovecii]|uniref:AMP-dependent synthetase/ligase domain-containing protein n=1 Tax=Pneumocystis jirovecii TaxID=42068 RepID=L0PGR0_PNEJI|nr:unnamed protein product [Pneumocystis jirovecii]